MPIRPDAGTPRVTRTSRSNCRRKAKSCAFKVVANRGMELSEASAAFCCGHWAFFHEQFITSGMRCRQYALSSRNTSTIVIAAVI